MLAQALLAWRHNTSLDLAQNSGGECEIDRNQASGNDTLTNTVSVSSEGSKGDCDDCDDCDDAGADGDNDESELLEAVLACHRPR